MADSSSEVKASGTQDYTEPVEDPYNKAISYLERHNILQLFQHLTSDVIFHRPDDPLDYLIKEVQQMKEQRDKADSK
ncbi:EF-hand calcium-binding domain-containing protein 10 [Plakobranchus ocellatus]|uniref:EF-hand calcium-binding domain-containing protein 10 n=1 Tax=Plakobranchus ocellatus TaxID=259542 RepID=A0AAV3ZEM6_9GAST|nr:EF-hand calcium-binding domain-containing protein 10 [Plakobranchus ocellatus]